MEDFRGASKAYIDAMEGEIKKGVEYNFGKIRALSNKLLIDRENNQELSKLMRIRGGWCKAWREEFSPLLVLADYKGFPNEDRLRWTPDDIADFIVTHDNICIKIQCTMAYPERLCGKKPGHVHRKEMDELNENGFFFGGGGIQTPKVRSDEENVFAWRSGIRSALTNKLDIRYAGCTLLIFAHGCRFDTIDLAFDKVVSPVLKDVGEPDWRSIFHAIYVVDSDGFFEANGNQS